MNDEIEDVIDDLLRERFEGPVRADGFCEQVMDRLPARRRRNAWPLVAGVLAGVAACGLSLSSSPITRAGWRDWLSAEPSAPVIALLVSMMGMAILALAWTLSEAEDRHDPAYRRMTD